MVGMEDIAFIDMSDVKLDKYTNPKLPWTQFHIGGLIRYRGLEAYYRYEGKGKVELSVDFLGNAQLHFPQGGMIVRLEDLTVKYSEDVVLAIAPELQPFDSKLGDRGARGAIAEDELHALVSAGLERHPLPRLREHRLAPVQRRQGSMGLRDDIETGAAAGNLDVELGQVASRGERDGPRHELPVVL